MPALTIYYGTRNEAGLAKARQLDKEKRRNAKKNKRVQQAANTEANATKRAQVGVTTTLRARMMLQIVKECKEVR